MQNYGETFSGSLADDGLILMTDTVTLKNINELTVGLIRSDGIFCSDLKGSMFYK